MQPKIVELVYHRIFRRKSIIQFWTVFNWEKQFFLTSKNPCYFQTIDFILLRSLTLQHPRDGLLNNYNISMIQIRFQYSNWMIYKRKCFNININIYTSIFGFFHRFEQECSGCIFLLIPQSTFVNGDVVNCRF